MPQRRIAIAFLVLVAAIASLPVPARTQAQNPCIAALALATAPVRPARAVQRLKYGRFGNDTRDVRDLLHSSNAARARVKIQAVTPAADRDENNIAILDDTGDLITAPNLFDL